MIVLSAMDARHFVSLVIQYVHLDFFADENQF
jgi:hypothetical protein